MTLKQKMCIAQAYSHSTRQTSTNHPIIGVPSINCEYACAMVSTRLSTCLREKPGVAENVACLSENKEILVRHGHWRIVYYCKNLGNQIVKMGRPCQAPEGKGKLTPESSSRRLLLALRSRVSAHGVCSPLHLVLLFSFWLLLQNIRKIICKIAKKLTHFEQENDLKPHFGPFLALNDPFLGQHSFLTKIRKHHFSMLTSA